MTFILHTQHDIVILRLRRGVKLRKLLLSAKGTASVVCVNDDMSLSRTTQEGADAYIEYSG